MTAEKYPLNLKTPRTQKAYGFQRAADDLEGLLSRKLEVARAETQAEFRPQGKHTDDQRGNTTMTRNDTPYLLRRLARERPDILQRYQAWAFALALLLLAAPAAAQTAIPPRPSTPAEIEKCVTDLSCSAHWLAGRLNSPMLLGRPRSGHWLKTAWRGWRKALGTGPAEPPPELLARPKPQASPPRTWSAWAPMPDRPVGERQVDQCLTVPSCHERWINQDAQGNIWVRALPRTDEELRRSVQEQRQKPPEAQPPKPGNELAETKPPASPVEAQERLGRFLGRPAPAAPGPEPPASSANLILDAPSPQAAHWLDWMAGFGLSNILVAIFMALVAIGATLKVSSIIVTTTFRAVGAIISPSAWWRGIAWLWSLRSLLRRQQKAPDQPWGGIRLPPQITRRFGRERIVEHEDRSGEQHIGVFGPPGSGKTWATFVPALISSWAASAIVNDVKGELHLATSGARARMGQRVLKFAPGERETCRVNLLDQVIRDPEFLVGGAERLSDLLLDVDKSAIGEDAFWRAGAARLTMAAIIHVRLGDPLDGLPAVARLLARGDAGLQTMRTAARHPICRNIASELLGGAEPSAKGEAIRMGFRTGALNVLSAFLDARVAAGTTGKSDLDLADLMCDRRQPISLYLASSLADRNRLTPLFRSLLGMTAVALTTKLNTDRSGRPKLRKCGAFVDEAAAAGWIGLDSSIALARGYGLVYMVAGQSRAQLRARYPGIISTLGVTINFGAVELNEARELSGIFGRERIVEKTTSVSEHGVLLPRFSGRTYSTRRVELPVLPEEEILSWMPRSYAVVTGRGRPYVGKFAPAFADPRYADLLNLPPPAVPPLPLLPEPVEGPDPDDPLRRSPSRRQPQLDLAAE